MNSNERPSFFEDSPSSVDPLMFVSQARRFLQRRVRVSGNAARLRSARPIRSGGCWLRRVRGLALMMSLILPFTACGSQQGTSGQDDMFGSSVTPMDYDPSDTFVRNTFIDGNWVGSAGTGGSIVGSGFSLPRRWHPGLTVTVKWERCEPYGKNCRWTEKVVPVHKYNRVGGTWLHILEDDQVLVIPSMVGPGHPAYPGPDFPTKDFFSNSDKDQVE